MANTSKKILLKSKSGDQLFPRVSLDNVVATAGSTATVTVPYLVDGKISSDYLPGYVDDIVDLLTIAGTAPAACAKDDKYFNSSSGNLKIYTATATNTWGTTGETPEKGKIYVNLANENIYRWSGTAMVEVSKQVATTTTVRAADAALDTVVPTEKAVRAAITNSSYVLPTASASTLGGVKIGTNISIASGVISVADASTSGKGVVQLIASVSASASAVDTKVPTEKAVRTELDKKQNTLTAGTNISLSGGTVTNTYTLPTASASTLGGVKTGSNITNSSGVISVADASTSAKGVVKLVTAVGTTLAADTVVPTEKAVRTELDKKQNTLTVCDGSDCSGRKRTIKYDTDSSTLSGVFLDDSLLVVESSTEPVYGLPDATASKKGGVSVQTEASNGAALTINSGALGITMDVATSSAKGTVQVSTAASNGAALTISSGTLGISMTAASESAKGTVELATSAETSTGTDATRAVTPAGLSSVLSSYITYEEIS